MNGRLHIRPRPVQAAGGSVTSTAELELPDGGRFELWYRLPERFAPMLSPDCDHFVLACLFAAMRKGADIAVHGRATPSLLANLQEFTAAWACWHPESFRRVVFAADQEREPEGPRPEAVAAGFSGGLDSAFTVWRHHRGLAGRRSLRISAGVLAHGFDIPLEDAAGFAAARKSAAAMMDSVGAELIPVATNLRGLVRQWLPASGAAVASVLALLKGGFSTGLIAASYEYDRLSFAPGSNPVSDQFLSGDSLRIVHDGAEYSRYEKTPALAGWPEGMRHLRVCFDNTVPGENCGRCVKCVTTMLGFRAHGLPAPEAFPAGPGLGRILRIKVKDWAGLRRLKEIPGVARRHGVHRSAWCLALRLAALRNIWRVFIRGARERYVRRNPLRLLLARLTARPAARTGHAHTDTPRSGDGRSSPG